MRGYLEAILPMIAAELKIGNDWNYRNLYLSILEASAKLLRIGKYRVYTVEELEMAVRKKAEGAMIEELPAFIHVILNH